jgi:hypothetical protein
MGMLPTRSHKIFHLNIQSWLLFFGVLGLLFLGLDNIHPLHFVLNAINSQIHAFKLVPNEDHDIRGIEGVRLEIVALCISWKIYLITSKLKFSIGSSLV